MWRFFVVVFVFLIGKVHSKLIEIMYLICRSYVVHKALHFYTVGRNVN